MKPQFTLLACALMLSVSATPGLALAESGGIGAVTVEPGSVKVGQAVKITITAEGEAPSRCGLAVELGDGSSEKIKIDGGDTKFPVILNKTYTAPGTYNIKAEGKKITTFFHCKGEAQTTVVVHAAAKSTTHTASSVSIPSCPPGYTLSGKPSRTGAYRCKAGTGAKVPEAPLDCAAPLEAYQTKTTVGCQVVKHPKK